MGIKPLPHFENLLHTFAMQYKIKVQGNVETVVLLSKGAKGPVDLCLAWTEAERRQATYEQIKAYVLKI